MCAGKPWHSIPDQLGGAIDGHRLADDGVLAQRSARRIAVDLGRGTIDEALHPGAASALQHVQGAGSVDVVVLDRLADRTADALNGKVEDGPASFQRSGDGMGIEDRSLHDGQAVIGFDALQPLAGAGGEVVENGDRIPFASR